MGGISGIVETKIFELGEFNLENGVGQDVGKGLVDGGAPGIVGRRGAGIVRRRIC